MSFRILVGDVLDRLRELPAKSVQCVVTSPPYFGLRDYGVDGQIGLESTPQEFVAKLTEVFREVRRVLRKDGTCWVNMGDSYATSSATRQIGRRDERPEYIERRAIAFGTGKAKALAGGNLDTRIESEPCGLKPKDLMGIPWRLAFALQDDGWYLRQDIIWAKPNPMPESVTDRCTKAHEYLFLLSKSERYYYDADAIKEPAEKGAAGSTFNGGKTALHQLGRASGAGRADSDTRNKRSVWSIATEPFAEAHFATFPTKLVEPCILAGSREGDTVLDPFNGAGTTGLVAQRLRRNYIGIELNPEYAAMSERRIMADCPLFYEGEMIA